ncbi:MAG: DUF4302 domain-containing protein [Marinifilaceae bacterium]|jgi:hypothetical protein|nr:DUF4302 domain-containing protein [Marinifilaceae bacterium]
MKNKILLAIFMICTIFVSCDDNEVDSLFNQAPDKRIQTKIAEFQNILTSSEYGWKLYIEIKGQIEYVSYNYVKFNDDNTFTIRTNEVKGVGESEYVINHESDIQLVFTNYIEQITSYSYPSAQAPKGMGADLEYIFKSVSEDGKVVNLRGKKFNSELRLEKAEKDLSDFSQLGTIATRINNERKGLRYMNLAITSGVEGATEDNPVVLGTDFSTLTKTMDFNYNYKDEFFSGRKMLYLNHDGLGLSSPITIDEKELKEFVYDSEDKRFELKHSDVQGYLFPSKLPQYHVPGVYDELMNKYSLTWRAAFGKAFDTYIPMKKANPSIKSFTICTNYKKRIPQYNDDGTPKLDEVEYHTYVEGEDLGNGILFSMDKLYQYDYIFIPINIEQIASDRIKMSLAGKGKYIHQTKEPKLTEAQVNTILANKELNDFISYMMNKDGWYITKTVEYGQIDWDFISLADPKNYFFAALK